MVVEQIFVMNRVPVVSIEVAKHCLLDTFIHCRLLGAKDILGSS